MTASLDVRIWAMRLKFFHPVLVDVYLRLTREIIRELQPPAGKDKSAAYDTLSPCEQEILPWVALGHSRNKIADTLFVGPATVHTHLKKYTPNFIRTTARRRSIGRGIWAY